jgi:recombinational DNA repair ATPase RecF
MIKIDAITIHEFRGIRNLELTPNESNFAACGPNGTGKSGIVDAIEFGLTGKISRLSGKGTGDLSVAKHGPHVDFRNKPDEAWVELTVSIPSLGGKKAVIRRTVKGANSPTVTPADADVLTALESVKLHPEFVLSRRELIRYVISEPGDRATEVQALLRLSDVGKLRQVLQKIDNACRNALQPLERAETEATKQLTTALGVTQLTKPAVLAVVNPHRHALGLPPFTDLTPATPLTDGLATTGAGATPQQVPKAQASSDLVAAKEALAALTVDPFVATATALVPKLKSLAADPAAAAGVKQEALLTTALDLYDGEQCPTCDTPFQPDAFVPHLKEKLAHLKDVADQRTSLTKDIAPLLTAIHAAGTGLASIIPYGGQLQPPVDCKALADFKQVLLGRYQQLQTFVPLEDTIAVLEVVYEVAGLTSTLEALGDAISALPEPTAQDAARQFLTIAEERLIQYRAARQAHAVGKATSEKAARVHSIFNTATTTALESIYTQVQDRFAEFYRELNKDDESAFTAKLIPSLGKLGFDVDFYGRGQFPPGAYHSEGHQDGMGLCLYLALMSHLLGDGFTIAVLDDVLMSVDKGHRREVCTLLKARFPNTQFIFTTHDDVWLRHMRSEGIITDKNVAHFKTWSVETGPAEWTHDTVWDEIAAQLAENNVPGASGTLRRYLEYFAGEASHRLRGKVEYRGDGQFMLGELLAGALSAMGDGFKKAKAAAGSWNQKEVIDAIGQRESTFTAARQAAGADQWQLNAAVHYNPWADLSREDFTPVAVAYKALVELYSCAICKGMFHVTPSRGPKEALRCGCGDTNLNLTGKTST